MRTIVLVTLVLTAGAVSAQEKNYYAGLPAPGVTPWDGGTTKPTPLPDNVPLDRASSLSGQPEELWWGSMPGALAGQWAPTRYTRRGCACAPVASPPLPPVVTTLYGGSGASIVSVSMTSARESPPPIARQDVHFTVDEAHAVLLYTPPESRLRVLAVIAPLILEVQRLDELLPLFDGHDRPRARALLAN